MVSNSEKDLIESIKVQDIDKILKILEANPKINLNCHDEEEFSPLQHACHLGNLGLIDLLLDKGADVNHTARKDGYTPLMLAAIGNRVGAVKRLLERGADKTSLNCVRRTASDMAAFVGLNPISAIINCWLPYEDTIKPFTKCLDLEDEPRIDSHEFARKLHEWIIFPSVHPIRLIFQLIDNSVIMKNADTSIFVMDTLSSKYLKPPLNQDTLSLKFHYLAELLRTCKTTYEQHKQYSKTKTFNESEFGSTLISYMRRLVKPSSIAQGAGDMTKLDELILKCLYSYPYNSATYQSLKFALTTLQSKRCPYRAMPILTQSIDLFGPRAFGRSEQSCEVCEEGENNKKCASCKKVYYCGSNCQKLDWPVHKKRCKTISIKTTE